MRTFFYCLTAIQFALAGPASAADFNKTIKVAAEEGKYTYVMFYRAEDTATRQMSSVIGQQVSKTARNTDWIKVDVTDQSAADGGVSKGTQLISEPTAAWFTVCVVFRESEVCG